MKWCNSVNSNKPHERKIYDWPPPSNSCISIWIFVWCLFLSMKVMTITWRWHSVGKFRTKLARLFNTFCTPLPTVPPLLEPMTVSIPLGNEIVIANMEIFGCYHLDLPQRRLPWRPSPTVKHHQALTSSTGRTLLIYILEVTDISRLPAASFEKGRTK